MLVQIVIPQMPGLRIYFAGDEWTDEPSEMQ